MQTIGFIGLGSMGLPMAGNLLAKGFRVRGYDVRPSAGAALAEIGGGAPARGAAGGGGGGGPGLPGGGARPGGTVAESAAAAAEGAEALVLMVVNAEQAETALFDQGALAALPPGALVVLMATCPPGAAAALAERVSASGRRFLDAPVSGGVVGAKAAALTIMAAGPRADFEAAQDLLAALGSRVFHVGERAGQGAMVKTVNQLLCGVHIAVLAEAFALAEKAGVALPVLLEIMSGSSAASWMLGDRGPRMAGLDPGFTSAVDIFVKDLGIVMEAGREAMAALPLAAIAHQLFLAASGRGEGAADDSQVIRSYRLLNGTAD